MNKNNPKKEFFFNNLLLLGFDVPAVEKEYKVTCDKNMFCLPNSKMFEVVTYFLFSKLNSVSKIQYAVKWPLLDRNLQREFKKSTYTHLTSIAQESRVRFPRMTFSLLSSFCGDKFYDLYFAFSSHVIEATIRKNDNVELLLRPKGSILNFQSLSEVSKISTNSSCKKFQRIQHLRYEHFKMLMNCAEDFMKLVQKLKSNIMKSEIKLKERLAALTSLCSGFPEEELNLKSAIKKTMEYEKKVERHWVQLEKFLEKEKKLWGSLCSAVEDHEMPILDGISIIPTVPDLLVEEYNEELSLIGSVKSDEDNKLYLLRFLKLFILYLECLSKSYKNGDLSRAQNLCILEEPPGLEDCLNELKCLYDKLRKDVYVIAKESSELLQKTLFVKDSSEELECYSKESPPWSFHSLHFQEKIKSSRSGAFLPLSNEVMKSSLLLNETSASNVKLDLHEFSRDNISISDHINELSTLHSSFVTTEALPVELRDHTVVHCSDGTTPLSSPDHYSSVISKNKPLHDSIAADSPVMDVLTNKDIDHVLTNKIFAFESEVQSANTACSLPILLDLDIDYSKPFKMRESWTLEDSLNAVTLPDDSLLD